MRLPMPVWWVYLLIALSLFIGCISLNYIVKKMNETRIEERFLRLANKTSTSQSTQVQFALIDMETRGADDLDLSAKGISLVFDKKENLNEKKSAIVEDLMHQVEHIIDTKEDDIALIKELETNSEIITDYEVIKQSETNSEIIPDSESGIDVIIKPRFLGNIYKSANNSDQDSIVK